MNGSLCCSLVVEIIELLFSVQWHKAQKSKKPERILLPVTPNKASVSQAATGLSQSSKSENLGDLKVALTGLSRDSRVRLFLFQFLFRLVGLS